MLKFLFYGLIKCFGFMFLLILFLIFLFILLFIITLIWAFAYSIKEKMEEDKCGFFEAFIEVLNSIM